MEILLAFVIGGLYAAAVYLLLRGSLVKLLIGLVLLAHAANLLIFVAADLVRARPPIIDPPATHLSPPFADPLPQALILTSIVISLGVTAFAIALGYRVNKVAGTEEVDKLRSTE